jgi:AraC-like DNA-binding protein
MKSLIENEIRKHYKNKKLTVQHLAENLNISQSYLREIVNANFMMSPQKLIETIRMEESVKLLLTDIEVYKISICVGYCSIRTFRKAFMNRFDISPGRFREKFKNRCYKDIRKQILKQLWD